MPGANCVGGLLGPGISRTWEIDSSIVVGVNLVDHVL